MKLDERTLPSGYRITTENPRSVRLTRGKMTKLNFGVAIHRVVRVEVSSDAAFEDNSTAFEAGLATPPRDNCLSRCASNPRWFAWLTWATAIRSWSNDANSY